MWENEQDIDRFVLGIEMDFGSRWPRAFGRPPMPPSDEVWQDFCWKNSRQQWIAHFGSEAKARAYCNTLTVGDAKFDSHPFLEWALKLAPTLLGDDWSRVSGVPVRPSWAARFNSVACRRNGDDAHVVLIFIAIIFGSVDLNQHMLHFLLDLDPLNPATPRGLGRLWMFFRSRQRMMKCAQHMAIQFDVVPPQWRVPQHQTVAAGCAYFQALFVLLHELAHVFHGHLGKLQTIATSSDGVAAELKVASLPELEYEADQTAFVWLLRLVDQPSLVKETGVKSEPAAVRFAIELATQTFFAGMAAVGRWASLDLGTHPPPLERARRLTGRGSPLPNRSPPEVIAALATLMRLEMWTLPSDRLRAKARRTEIERVAADFEARQ